MKQQYAVIVLFALVVVSSLTSLDSYRSTSRKVCEDMERALALALEEQQSDVISRDTIRTFNRHLQIAALRGKATIAVDTRSPQFRAYAHCSEATIFWLSDQRPAALLWVLTGFWAVFVCLNEERRMKNEEFAAAIPNSAAGKPTSAAGTLPVGMAAANSSFFIPHSSLPNYGGLTYAEAEGRFYAADGKPIRLTPMQHQLLTMFYRSPSHVLSKAEICEALWPKKPDASETLYTLIRRLKPIVEQHTVLKIESDRSKSYRLEIKEIAD